MGGPVAGLGGLGGNAAAAAMSSAVPAAGPRAAPSVRRMSGRLVRSCSGGMHVGSAARRRYAASSWTARAEGLLTWVGLLRWRAVVRTWGYSLHVGGGSGGK